MQNCSIFLRQLKFLNGKNIFRNSNRYMGLFQKNVFVNRNCRIYNITATVGRIQYFTSQNVFLTSTIKPRSKVSNISDLKEYISKGKQFYLKLLTNILNSVEYETISNEDAELLLECCGQSVADSSKQIRNEICQKIYKNLFQHNKLDLSVYNTYIKVCTENDIVLNITESLTSLKLKPSQNTYKFLLDNVCEKGDIEQAHKVLKIMKNDGMSADEDVFNKLVLGYTVHDGLKAGESVLLTMRTAQIPETTNTKYSILKGVAKRNCAKDLENVLLKYKIEITESNLLELLEIIAVYENIAWLPKMQTLYSNMIFSREFFNNLEKVCIHLVHMGKSESAMTIYKEFVEPAPEKNYAFFLLKEMLHCNIYIENIISIAKRLRDDELNKYALENLMEIALRHNYTEESWRLLENLSELRTHFFWPLLINANEKEGEKGVLTILKKMISMNIKIDSDTLQFYVLPFYDPSNFKYLIKKLFDIGLRVTDVLSPMLMVLLGNNKVQQAADLCSNYNVPISGDNFLNLLSSAWTATQDRSSVVSLLQRYCETNSTQTDLVGEFLIKTLNVCKTQEHFTHYLSLIELIHERKLRIDSTSGAILHNVCSTTCKTFNIAEKIRDQIDGLLNFELQSEVPLIPHPKNMKIDELECHLLELQEKGMETRGVLRKLIQMHSNLGNLQRVEQLRELFLKSGYGETIGMKSSLMHSYVKGGRLEAALNIYNEIKNCDANFNFDDFKVIDLATLLVKENSFNGAMDILQTETKSKRIIGGPAIERNCRDLLASFKNEEEQLEMFNFLTENGYCKPTNVILGPLVRIYLSRDLIKAADAYITFANKYKCTPLQLEIICAILKSKDESLLHNVLKATESVHGVISTQEALIAALSENGQEKVLTKLLANNKILCKTRLEKRCERWINEGKIEALQTLANACQRLPEEFIDLNFVYNCIMKTFSLNHDIKGATEFYEKLLEKDLVICKDLEEQINRMKKIKKVTERSLNC